MRRAPGELAAALRRRIVSGLHLGLIQIGQRLPSARTVAREFGMDPRAVLNAYRALEREGLVELRRRSGVYVADSAGEHGRPSTRLADWAVGVFREGIALGVRARELPERLLRCIDTLRLKALCLECNDDQLYSLCEELSSDYGLETTPILLKDLGSSERQADTRRADLLVTTAFHAAEVRAAAERLGKPWIAIALREDIVEGILREMRRTPIFFVATDPRFLVKLREMWADYPGAENIQGLLAGHDDLDQIPRDAPVVIMKRAGTLIPGHSLLSRAPPPSRVLSPASSQELLSFIVRANLAAMAARGET